MADNRKQSCIEHQQVTIVDFSIEHISCSTKPSSGRIALTVFDENQINTSGFEIVGNSMGTYIEWE